MQNVDELLKRVNKFKFDYATRHGTALLDELAATIRAQQAEIERLKGENAKLREALEPTPQKVQLVARAICEAQGDTHWHEPNATAGRAFSLKVAREAIAALIKETP